MAIRWRLSFRVGVNACAFLAYFFVCAMPVRAWDKGGKGGAHKWSPGQAVHGAGHRISESVHRGVDQAIQNVREGVRQGKERLDALSAEVQHDVADSSAHFKESIALDYQELKRSSSHALTAEYKRRLRAARRALAANSQSSSAQLRESMLDEAARERALDAAPLVAASVGIAALKAISVFDSDIGKLVTLDALVRAAIAAIGASDASGFGTDPLAAVFLLMFDSDYLLKARIIRSPFGDEYLSIADLIGLNIEDAHLGLAKDAYHRSRFSWKVHGDAVLAAQQAETFYLELRLVNAPAGDEGRRQAVQASGPD